MPKDSRHKFWCQFCQTTTPTHAGLQRHFGHTPGCRNKRDALVNRRVDGWKRSQGLEQDMANPEAPTDAFDATFTDSALDPELDAVDGELSFDAKKDTTYQQGLADVGGASEAEGDRGRDSSSSTCNGNSRFVCESFPGDAGKAVGVGTPKFVRINSELHAARDNAQSQSHPISSTPSPILPQPISDHLLDPELWGLAHWLMSSGLTAGARDEFFKLKFTQKRTPWKSEHLFKKDIDSLPSGPSWKRVPHRVDGDNGSFEDLDIWLRDPIECIEELIGNPAFAEHLRYAPERVYKRGPDGTERVYGEMWTANWWWEMQELLSPKDPQATIVPLILASDKTQLSTFSGDKAAWPVYLTIGNLPKALRRKTSLRTTILVAYLPVSKLTIITNEIANRHARWDLFHKSMGTVIQNLVPAGTDGVEVTCADSNVRRIYPLVAAYIADFPEQCLVVGCSESRCPICETPADVRGSIESFTHPTRSKASTLRAMAYRKRNAVETDEFLELGLRPVWPFWAKLPHFSPFKALTPDALHQLHKGLFKDHLVRWAQHTIGKKELDRRFDCMPHQQGIRHFTNGFSRISLTTGHEHREMEKVFLGACANSTVPLIKCARSLLDYTYTSHFSYLTESDVTSLESNFQTFHACKDEFKDCTGPKEFNGVPKVHVTGHHPDAIRSLGAPDGFNSEGPERCHIDYGKEAWEASNHVNAFPQMTKFLSRQESIRLWDAWMAWAQDISSSNSHTFNALENLKDDDGTPALPSSPPSPPPNAKRSLITRYPNPQLLIASNATIRKKSVAYIGETFDLPSLLLTTCINEFVKSSSLAHFRQSPVTGTDVIDVWTRARLFHDLCNLPTLDASASEVLQARPPKKDSHGCITSPGSYSTALHLDNTQASGLHRYRVVRVRLIFKLPPRLLQYYTKHLALVERFSPFPHQPARAKLQQYTVKPSLLSNGDRQFAVLPLDTLKLTCHLTPHFDKMQDSDWNSTDIISTCSHFYFNEFASHILYGFMHQWK